MHEDLAYCERNALKVYPHQGESAEFNEPSLSYVYQCMATKGYLGLIEQGGSCRWAKGSKSELDERCYGKPWRWAIP
jgi:hypothetical protein